MSKVAPVATATPLLSARLPPPLSASVPLLTAVAPVKRLASLVRVTVPPATLLTIARVPGAPVPFSMRPERVRVLPFESIAAPVVLMNTPLLERVSPVAPACSVPPSNVSAPVPIEDDVPGVELVTCTVLLPPAAPQAVPQIVVPPV